MSSITDAAVPCLNKPRIGVSACLLGQPVRFDGGHKWNHFIMTALLDLVELVPVCPETEAGFGVPRPAMQLRRQGDGIRLVISEDPGQDLTGPMNRYARSKVDGLGDLDGFIFKKGSPSCGLFRVPVVSNQDGYKIHAGTGLFARAYIERYPLIPVEEEGRLNDAALCENFFARVYACHQRQLPHDTLDLTR